MHQGIKVHANAMPSDLALVFMLLVSFKQALSATAAAAFASVHEHHCTWALIWSCSGSFALIRAPIAPLNCRMRTKTLRAWTGSTSSNAKPHQQQPMPQQQQQTTLLVLAAATVLQVGCA